MFASFHVYFSQRAEKKHSLLQMEEKLQLNLNSQKNNLINK